MSDAGRRWQPVAEWHGRICEVYEQDQRSWSADRQAVLGLQWLRRGAVLWGVAGSCESARAQDNPLGEVHTQPPPPPPKTPEDSKPVIEGAENAAAAGDFATGRANPGGCEPGAGSGDGDRSDEPPGDRAWRRKTSRSTTTISGS